MQNHHPSSSSSSTQISFQNGITDMEAYVYSRECLSRRLVTHFGEEHSQNCGKCSVCLSSASLPPLSLSEEEETAYEKVSSPSHLLFLRKREDRLLLEEEEGLSSSSSEPLLLLQPRCVDPQEDRRLSGLSSQGWKDKICSENSSVRKVVLLSLRLREKTNPER